MSDRKNKRLHECSKKERVKDSLELLLEGEEGEMIEALILIKGVEEKLFFS